MIKKQHIVLKSIQIKQGEIADLNAKIERLDFKVHRMKSRLDSTNTEGLSEADIAKKRLSLENDLWSMERDLAEFQAMKQSMEAGLNVLIERVKWD